MTAQQLHRFCRDHNIAIPKSCTLTRQSLYDIVKTQYAKWDKVLSNQSTELHQLITIFDSIDDWNDVCEAKEYLRNKFNLLEPGNEVLVM